jgi:hypothetical protein
VGVSLRRFGLRWQVRRDTALENGRRPWLSLVFPGLTRMRRFKIPGSELHENVSILWLGCYRIPADGDILMEF